MPASPISPTSRNPRLPVGSDRRIGQSGNEMEMEMEMEMEGPEVGRGADTSGMRFVPSFFSSCLLSPFYMHTYHI